MRCRLLGSITGADSLACLLPTIQCEMTGRGQPFRQYCEGLPAWAADAAADPDALVISIVRLPQSPPVTDDRVAMAKWAEARQEIERNHPGSSLSCPSVSAIKRITAGVKARRRLSPGNDSICWPGLHPPGVKSNSNEKIILLQTRTRDPLIFNIGR